MVFYPKETESKVKDVVFVGTAVECPFTACAHNYSLVKDGNHTGYCTKRQIRLKIVPNKTDRWDECLDCAEYRSDNNA